MIAIAGLATVGVLAMTAASVALLIAGSRDAGDPARLIQGVALDLVGLSFGGTALFIVLARPGNRIGWLLLMASLSGSLMAVGSEYRSYGRTHPGVLPAVEEVGHASDNGWAVTVTLFFLLLQLFPDGRSLRGPWRSLAVATVAWPLTVVPLQLIATENFSGGRPVPNPDGVSGPIGEIASRLLPFVFQALVPLLTLSVASLVTRYRRGGRVERLQLRWVLFAAFGTFLLGLPGLVGAQLPTGRWLGAAANVLMLVGLPSAIAIAILRYRLYDIDVLINRTLVYASVSGILVATYAAGVVLLQNVLRPFTAGSDLAVAISTLLVVALFQPLRRRMQDAVDRRFYRARYDATRSVDAFTSRLRNEVDIDSVRGHLLDVVGETVRPAHASVWLRDAAR